MATLTFLKVLRNWRKPAVQNLADYCGTIWYRREKPYWCTTTVLHMNTAPKIFWKIYLLYDFLFVQSHFWTLVAKFDNCCQCYIVTCGKNLYRCISTFSTLNYCGGILFKSHSYLYNVVRKTFLPIFGLVAIFVRNLAKKVAPSGHGNVNSNDSERAIPSEKNPANSIKIDP